MTTSSVPNDCSITSNDTITVSSIPGIDTITIDTSSMANISAASGGLGNVTINGSSYYTLGSGISLSSPGINTISPITIDQLSTYSSFQVPEEWEGRFPDWERIQSMCDEYPGLKIAYEKFKTTYKLVKDHYDTPEDQRPCP
jgi:hypothetical protein